MKQTAENEIFTQCSNLESLGIQVSTCPIVDFRMKNFLLKEYAENYFPLVYPVHLMNNRFSLPQKSKKT